jgi:cystathionine beta-lyase/cystathionine gamma-synthase
MDNISEILNLLGEEEKFYANPVVPPIYQTSNFYFKSVEELRSAFRDEQSTSLYTRGNNPTVDILRQKIAALANADDALIVSSGVSAISISLLANLTHGDHIICIQNPYSWTEKFCKAILSRFGIETTFWDGINANDLEGFIKSNTKIVYLESPNTFTFELQDLKAISAICKANNVLTIIDNTYSTPIGQRCIELGIDIELHSISKYINGHSDVIAGAIISNKNMIAKIFKSEFLNIGAVLSPHNAWLVLRGLRTLPQRMKAITETTRNVVEYLKSANWVKKVMHPSESDSPQYLLASEQMNWYGGLFSINLNTEDVSKIDLFCNNLRFFKMAVSWGGHESLIMPCAAFYPKDYSGLRKYPISYIRLYIGLENSDTLITDLKQAAKYLV